VAGFAGQVRDLIDHDRLSIYMLTAGGTALERFAVATSPSIPGERDLQPLERVGLSRVIRENRPIVSADFGSDERILGIEDALVAAAGYFGLLSVPIRIQGQPFGLMNFVSRRRGFYSEADAVLAQLVSDQVSVFLLDLWDRSAGAPEGDREPALQRAERVVPHNGAALSRHLDEVSDEIERLATEAVENTSVPVDRLTDLRSAIIRSRGSLRRTLDDPSLLKGILGGGVAAALGHLVDRLTHDTGIVTTLSSQGDASELPADVTWMIANCAHAALSNVRVHSAAEAARVSLTVTDSEAVLSVADDGRGFAPEGLWSHADGGIRAAREMVQAMGGHLMVTASPSRGTEVVLRVPLERNLHPVSRRPQRSRPGSRGHGVADSRVVRALVVDEQPVFRYGLTEVLHRAGGIRVIGTAGTGASALARARLLRPDLVLVDLDLPDVAGFELAAQLGGAVTHRPVVIVMSAFADDELVSRALSIGARGFISKRADTATWAESIRAAMSGSTIVNGASWPRAVPSRGLTVRELEILRLVSLGWTNGEMAGELHLAIKTIERIVATAVLKLDARNRSHAAARCVALRLVDPRSLLA